MRNAGNGCIQSQAQQCAGAHPSPGRNWKMGCCSKKKEVEKKETCATAKKETEKKETCKPKKCCG